MAKFSARSHRFHLNPQLNLGLHSRRLRQNVSRLLIALVCLAQILPALPAAAASPVPPAAAAEAPANQTANAMVVGEVFNAADGMPVAAASVRQVVAGNPGAGAVVQTDASGRFRLPVAAGSARLRIEKPGFTSVERVVTTTASNWTAAQDVFVTALDANAVTLVSVVGGQVTGAGRSGATVLSVPPGALANDQTITVTPLEGIALAGALPLGWSPIAAADVQPAGLALAGAVSLNFPVPAGLPAGATLVAVRWDAAAGSWVAEATVAAPGAAGLLPVTLSTLGQYALVLADAAPVAPPAPAIGSALSGVAAPALPANVTAEISPAPRILLTGEDARSLVSVALMAPQRMPSGTVVEVEARETLEYLRGSRLVGDMVVRSLPLYAFPAGAPEAPVAQMLLGPSLAVAPHDLRFGTIDLTVVLPDAGENGALVQRAGTTLTLPAFDVNLPRNAVQGATPARLRALDLAAVAPLLPASLTALAGGTLDMYGASLALAGTMTAPLPAGVTANQQLLLVRLHTLGGETRLELIAPATIQNNRLRATGILREGRYLFVRTAAPLGYVTGAVGDPQGALMQGVLVTSSASPLVSLTGADGRYIVAGPSGPAEIVATNLTTRDTVKQAVTIGAPGSFASVNLGLTATGPVVLQTLPAANAENVPITATVRIDFSEALDPASVTANALTVKNGAVVVPGAMNLLPGGQTLTFVPTAFWNSNTNYSITVDGALKDLSGNSMAQPVVVNFKVVNITPPPAPLPGQVTASLPDAAGNSTVAGTLGTADPNGLVLVRNKRNAALTTATPNANGSFSMLVPALLSDKFDLILRDGSGNETKVALPRFVGADGSVVMGSEGGRVEDATGAAAVIDPGTLPDGTVVKVENIPAAEMPLPPPMALSSTMPYVGGIELTIAEGVTPTKYIDLEFPAPADASANDIVFVTKLVTVTQIVTGTNGVAQPVPTQVWALIDRASLQDGKYVTASPPFPGAISSGAYGAFKTSNIITPGPDGDLDTMPWRPTSDDELEDRPVVGRVVAPGPDGILQTQPMQGSDDELQPECVSFVTVEAFFGFQVGVFSIGLPYFFPVVAGSTTISGFCNQQMEVRVVAPDTGATVMRVTRTAPAGRNDIFYSPDVISDDTSAPEVVDVTTPTRLFDGSEDVAIRFSERMRQSTFDTLQIVDEAGRAVAGEAISTFGTTGLLFRPQTPFRLEEQYTIQFGTLEDLAGNAVNTPPLSFRRAAPQSLGELRANDDLFSALARCPGGTDPCYMAAQGAVLVGDLLFLANGVRDMREYYLADRQPSSLLEAGEGAMLAVVNIANPAEPKLVGWHRTFTDPRALNVVQDVSFPYTPLGQQTEVQFDGDLLVVIGGGRPVNNINTASKLEVYDITACLAQVAGNCLAEPTYNEAGNWQHVTLKTMKFLSTALNGATRPGVPPDMGVALDVETLHQVILQDTPSGTRRKDTVVAYVGVVPIGIASIDLVKAFGNANSTAGNRFAIDGLYRGDFFDLAIMKNGLLAAESPSSGREKLKVFSASLYPMEEVVLPRAFRVAAGESIAFDLDDDGNLGAAEQGDGDATTALDEIFDLAFVSGTPRDGRSLGELYIVDVSHLTDLEHDQPLTDPNNLDNVRIVSRIPLPGSARGVCVDADARIAYVSLLDTGVAMVDLNHLLGIAQGRLDGSQLIDVDGDLVDDRVLHVLKSDANPVQGVQGAPCVTFRNDSFVMNWENTGPEFYGSYSMAVQTPVRIKSDVDVINNQLCQAQATLDFSLSNAAEVTVKIDGQIVTVPGSALGSSAAQIAMNNVALDSGAYSLPIPPTMVTDPGEIPFTVQAIFQRTPQMIEQQQSGLIIHDIVKRAALPVGHTMIEGVDLWDGHLTHGAQDLALPGRGPDLEFARTWSSAGSDSDSALGAGWTHNLDIKLLRDGCGRLVVVGGEGTGNAFADSPAADAAKAALYNSPLFPVAANALWYPPQIGYHSSLVRAANNQNEYDFFTKSHVRYHFVRESALAGEVYTLRFIADTNGNRLTFDYISIDADGATLDTVTDSAGRTLRLNYSTVASRKRIVELQAEVSQNAAELDAAPNITLKFGYDTIGNLVAVTRTTPYAGFNLNDQRVETYTYAGAAATDPYNMTSATDANGNTTTYVFHTAGNGPDAAFPSFNPQFGVARHEFVKAIQKPENVTLNFGYSLSINPAVPNLRTVSDPRTGVAETVYTLDNYGATVKVQAPQSHTTTMTWCTELPLPAGCAKRDAIRVGEVDALGRTTTYLYDAQGNVTQSTLSFGTTPPAPLQPVLNSAGAPVASITTRATYDPIFNRVTSETDAEGNTTWYCLDSPVAPPAGSPCLATSGKTGNLLAQIDAEGSRIDYAYYPNGDLKSATDALGKITAYTAYDRFGNATRVEQPEGAWAQTTYDARSRVRETTDSFGHHTRITYDGLDRAIKVERLDDRGDGGAAQIEQTLYLAGGQIKRTTNGLGQITDYTYDGLSRKLSMKHLNVVQAQGAPQTLETRWSYDAVGNVLTETDARGTVQTHTYDALSRRMQTTVKGASLPAQGIVSFAATYDSFGNLLTLADMHGFVTTYTYDALLRVVETVLPYTHTYNDVPFQAAMVRQRYDLVGNVIYQTDANGNAMRTEYDNVYRVVRTIAPDGVESVIEYDAAGNNTVNRNETTGLEITRTFDGLGRVRTLTQVAPLGAPGDATATYVTEYLYDDADNAVIIQDARGIRTRTDNDGLDRIYQIVVDVNGLAQTSTYTYDANGNTKTTQDAQGNDIDERAEYDGLNRRIRITYAAVPDDGGQPVTESFVYDGASNLVAHRDRRGIETRFTYDGLDRVLVQSVVETISNNGAVLPVETRQYNDTPVGGLFSVVSTDANGNATTTRYNALGFIVEIDDAAADGTLRFLYDAVNQREAIDKKNQSVRTTFDAVNRPTLSQEYSAGGALQGSHSTAYDPAAMRVTVTDRRGNSTITQQDALGRVVAVFRTGANMAADYGAAQVLVERYEYDGNGNVVAHIDGRGGRTEYRYDGADRQTEERRAVGTAVANTIVTTFDAAGNVLTVKDGRNHGGAFDIKHTYDARYRTIATTNGENETVGFAHDAAGNVVRTTDARGGVTTFRYDEFNQLLSVDDATRAQPGSAAGRTLYAYDANRNLIAQQDANGNLTTWRYDVLDRQTDRYQHTVSGALTVGTPRGANPKGDALYAAAGGNQATALRWQYGYDANNNQISVTDARGQVMTMTVDHLNRPLTKSYTNPAEAALDGQIRSITATWDGNSNPLTVTETKVRGGSEITESTSFTYDAFDRVQTRTRLDAGAAVGKTIAYDYDVNGNRTAMTDPDGIATAYAYDALNRLLSVQSPAGTTTYQWWEDDLPKAVVYPNNTWQNLSLPGSYDRADRLTRIESGPQGPATPFSVYQYSYDDNGNRTQQVESQQAINGGAPTTTTYVYDASNRLLQATYGAPNAGQVAYTWDAVGNRLSEQGTDPASGQAVNRTYQYVALAGRPNVTFSNVNTLTRIVDNLNAANTVEYTYDANLNQTAKIVGTATTAFKYDVRDQMIAATVGAVTTRFDYDASGSRTRKLSGSGTGADTETRYLYDDQTVLLEYSAAGATTAKYDYGYALIARTLPSAVPANVQSDFYMLDALGSVANLADKNGALAHSYRYDAWGNEIASVGSSTNARQYTGHYHDDETGLDYFGARYYDATTGRFMNQDAYTGDMSAPPSLHKYLYANANPLRFVDPTGYASVEATGSSGGQMTQLANATEGAGGTRGYYSFSAKGEELNKLKGWINDENPHRAGEVAVDEEAMTGAWAGDLARRVQKWSREKEAALDEWELRDPGMAHWALNKIGSGGLQLLSGASDTLKLGEGLASGLNKIDKAFTTYDSSLFISGYGDILTDGFRAADAISGVSGLVRGVSRFGVAMLSETIPGITKRVGQRLMPMTVVAPLAERAIQKHVRDTGIEISVRAVDPITSLVARLTQTLGLSKPKPMSMKAKTIFGLASDRGMLFHSDMDIAWARATKTIYGADGKTILIRKGAYLTDDQVLARVVEPLNLVLPDSMKFQHGAHFSSHKAFGGTLNYADFGKYPGHPGPISVYTGDTMKMMGIREVEQYAKLGNHLPWHPVWDKKSPINFNTGKFVDIFTPSEMQMPRAMAYVVRGNSINEK